jgi:hypothetical protein
MLNFGISQENVFMIFQKIYKKEKCFEERFYGRPEVFMS